MEMYDGSPGLSFYAGSVEFPLTKQGRKQHKKRQQAIKPELLRTLEKIDAKRYEV